MYGHDDVLSSIVSTDTQIHGVRTYRWEHQCKDGGISQCATPQTETC